MRVLVLCILILLVVSALATPTSAQEPAETPTPDPQKVLERANAAATRAEEAAALAEGTADQADYTLTLVNTWGWFITLVIVVAATVLAILGFNNRRGFEESLEKYKERLDRADAEHRENLSAYRVEQKAIRDEYKAQLDEARAANRENREALRKLRDEITDALNEAANTREELSQFRGSVKREFENITQSLRLLYVGDHLFDKDEVSEAIQAYEEAHSLQPGDADINYRLGRAYSEAGRLEEAIQALNQAVETRPNFAEANAVLGMAYRRRADLAPSAEERTGEYRTAMRYLRRATELKPDYEDALAPLGGLYRREGRYEDALSFYEKAAIVDPNSSYALGNVASLNWYLGNTDLARHYFERTEQAASQNVEDGVATFWSYYDRALARLVLDQQEEAIKDHKYAIARTPQLENYRSVLDNLRFLKRAPETIKGIDEFIDLIEARLPKEDDQGIE